MSGSVAGDVALGVRAERAGFDGVYSIEFFNRHGYVPLAAIAAKTSRIRIGTAIANAFTRTPLLHASAAMDLDELSGGRMVLGLGSGTRRMNEDWYDVRFDRPAARMRELVTLLNRAFDAQKGGGLRFEGEFWNLSDSMMSRSLMISRLSFGTSMPREDLPGMRWMRTDSVPKARARSSVRLATWATLMPGAGKYS